MSATKPYTLGKRLFKALWVGLFGMVIGLMGLILAMNIAYASVMLPNTTVGGISVDGLTKEAALRVVEHAMTDRQQLTIDLGDERLTTEAIEVGITYDVTTAVNRAYLRGKGASIWRQMADLIMAVRERRDYMIDPIINQESLSAYINDQIAGRIKPPQDASLAVVGSTITIINDVPGTAINLEQIKRDIGAAVSRGGVIEIRAEVKQVRADITSADLKQYQDQIQQLAATPVTITAQDKTLTPTLAQKVSWFVVTKNDQKKLQLTVDQTAVTNMVAILSKQVDTKMIKEQVTVDGTVVAAGKDGSALDRNGLTTALINQLQLLQTAPIQLAAVVTAVPKENVTVTPNSANVAPAIDTEAKFIQINLGQQKMYLFENHQLVNVFPISSGKAGYETPKGVHSITNKALRPFSKIYGLYLPYWNAISADGKYGIHDLPEWPGGYKEGESHLGRPVSHGCVRLGSGPAKYLYEWAPIGTAVVVQ